MGNREVSFISQYISEFSSLYLVSVASQADLSLTWSETPKTGFSHNEAHLFIQLGANTTGCKHKEV